MATFRDDKGRDWLLEFNCGLLFEIKERIGRDMLTTQSQAVVLAEMEDDMELLCNVLFLMCERQCETKKVDQIEFARGLASGEGRGRAVLAIKESFISFTPPHRREILTAPMRVREESERLMESSLKKALAVALTSGD